MNGQPWGVVLFGDVVHSRSAAQASTAWLERLRTELDDRYTDERLAEFEFTQGDEIQGLLAPTADPFAAVLHATLQRHAGPAAVPRMRWVIVAGRVDPGHGPATRRTGDAFVMARQVFGAVRARHDGLCCRTGDARADELLDGTAPVLASIIEAMTDRQREVARLALVEGLRQSEIADRLGIARATVSVSWARGGVPNLERLVRAIRAIWREGVEHAAPGETAS
jgi:DNA-binding CsgD family transcriptional regulator